MTRGKPPKTIRPVRKNLCLPEDVVARIDLELYSELEQKVPFGAWQKLMERLLRQHLEAVNPTKEST